MTKATHPSERVTVPELAARLQGVIEARGLVPGDRFLTTEEAARYLRVRSDLANRALQVLVHRGRIERKQRIGATVADPSLLNPALEKVHVLVQENHGRKKASFSAAAQAGLHSALVGSELEIHVLASGGAEEVLDPLIRRSLRGGNPEGLVLVRCDYPTQRQARDSGLSAVVHGTTYAGIDLPSVDVDAFQMGGLQVESLAARQCQRMVVIRRDRTLPGDRRFMEGFRQAAHRAGIGPDRITELEIAPYAELVRAELAMVFAGDETLGIVCANEEFAAAALTAAEETGRKQGSDVWLQVNDVRQASRRPAFPYLEPAQDLEAQGADLGRLLAARLADPLCAAENILVPCALVQPGATTGAS